MADGIIDITNEAEFTEKVEQSPLPTIVDFWATWCGPCQVQGKILEELAGKAGDKVRIVKVNVDEVPTIAQRFGVQSIPTLLFYKDGELTGQKNKLTPIEELESAF